MFQWLKKLFGFEKKEQKELPPWEPEQDEKELAARIDAEVKKPITALEKIRSKITSAIGTQAWEDEKLTIISIRKSKNKRLEPTVPDEDAWSFNWENIALSVAAFKKSYLKRVLTAANDKLKLKGTLRRSQKTEIEWISNNLSHELDELVALAENIAEYENSPGAENVYLSLVDVKDKAVGTELMTKIRDFDNRRRHIIKILEDILA